MAKLSPEQIAEYSGHIASLEAEEPLVGCWRYHVETEKSSSFLNTLIGLTGDYRYRRWHLPQPNPGQVIALGYRNTPATWGSLQPVLSELKAQGTPAFLVTGPSSKRILAEGLHDGNLDIIEILAAASPLCRIRNLAKAKTLASRLRTILPKGSATDAERWLELAMSIRDVTCSWLSDENCVVSDSDIEAPRMGFMEGARLAGVSTVILQHGFFGPHQFPLHADRLLCWGSYFADQAAGYGLSRKRAQAVGCPRWDHLPGKRGALRDPQIEAALGWSGAKPRVLVISNAHGAPLYPAHYDAFFSTVGRLVESGASVTIKLHPIEANLGSYKERLPPEITRLLRVVPLDVSLHEALRHADVAYNVFSAAAVEAMLLGVPVLFEAGANATHGQLCDLPDTGGGVWCTGEEAVALAAELAVGDDRKAQILGMQDAFLDIAFTNIGRASSAVIESIRSG